MISSAGPPDMDKILFTSSPDLSGFFPFTDRHLSVVDFPFPILFCLNSSHCISHFLLLGSASVSSGRLSLNLSSFLIPSPSVTCFYFLNPAQPQSKNASSVIYCNVYTTVSFSCLFTASLPLSTAWWTPTRSTPLTESNGPYTLEQTTLPEEDKGVAMTLASITIDNATVEMDGVFVCAAQNFAGITSTTITLRGKNVLIIFEYVYFEPHTPSTPRCFEHNFLRHCKKIVL